MADSSEEMLGKAPDGKPYDAQPKWRQDFPLETELDEYVSRRDFVKFLVLVSGSFSVGQLWIGAQSWMREREDAPSAKRVIGVDEIAVGTAVSFSYPSEKDPCVLMRPEEDVYVAYSQKCTHLTCAVLPNFEKSTLDCPCHKGAFDLTSGQPTGGPPSRPLPRIVLDVRDDGIYATGVELRS